MLSPTNRLINKVFGLQSLFNRQAGNSDPNPPIPFITIARDPGSGGKPIAKLVSQKLHFEFYDRQLIESISKSARRRKDIITSVDEQTRSAIQDIVHNFINPEYISDTTYINHLTKVILTIIHKRPCVILGRGANFIAPSTHGLNVLITAPKQVRIARAIEFDKLTPKEAKKQIDKISKERRQFIAQYFHKSYTSPNHYDLILNTSYYNIDASSDLIISAFRKKFPSFKELIKTTLKKTGKLY